MEQIVIKAKDTRQADVMAVAFREGFRTANGPEIKIDRGLPDIDIGAELKKDAIYIGGYARRTDMTLAQRRSVCNDVGVEAARYIRGVESVGLKDYKQGVLTEGGIDERPMPEGYKPLFISLISKELGAAGTGDPLNQFVTEGWKALCVRGE